MKSFIKDKNSNCCQDDGGNGGSEPKDCLDKWKIEHEEVCNKYSVEAAETERLKEAYENSLAWETKLKNWCNLIEATDGKVKAVVTELDFLLEQIGTVCVKSKCTYEVLQKLTCLVKTIFDYLYTYEKGEEGLKKKVVLLKELIDCLKHLDDKDKDEIIACIEAYEEKIKLVCELQEGVLTKLLETLKCATLLWAYICGELGLENKLQGIRNILSGTSHDEGDCDDSEEKEDHDTPQYPCDHKKAKPMPEFPIKDETTDTDTASGNTYYVKIKGEFKDAENMTKSLKDQWVDSKKISDKTLSEKTSLAEAIKVAEALNTGK
ncbi:hypothetical protein [Aquimarina sediminis]|uniref:hypothetical protein n=1 Tax=Aquimarina sediminis TaxID=2070536 RepID=UPI000C9FFDB8|nr:hypothetical protein [Aquimarina sediminis]